MAEYASFNEPEESLKKKRNYVMTYAQRKDTFEGEGGSSFFRFRYPRDVHKIKEFVNSKIDLRMKRNLGLLFVNFKSEYAQELAKNRVILSGGKDKRYPKEGLVAPSSYRTGGIVSTISFRRYPVKGSGKVRRYKMTISIGGSATYDGYRPGRVGADYADKIDASLGVRYPINPYGWRATKYGQLVRNMPVHVNNIWTRALKMTLGTT